MFLFTSYIQYECDGPKFHLYETKFKNNLQNGEGFIADLTLQDRVTINVPLFKKLRDIIFFFGTITL